MPSTVKTLRHKMMVAKLMMDFAAALLIRAGVHDDSKFSAVEKEPLDEMERLIAEEGQAPFGSEEYERRRELLGPMLEHHYKVNSHHPEHHAQGIDGMDLLDLVEMFLDWKAASERGEESAVNLTASAERFNVSPQLLAIFQNTCTARGWQHK